MANPAAEPPSPPRLKVLLGTEDDRLLRTLDDDRIDVAQATTTADIRRIAALDEPDVVLVDVTIAGSPDWSIEQLHSICNATVVVVVDHDRARRSPLPPGAAAYITIPPLDDLVDILVDILAIASQLGSSKHLGARGG